MDKFRMQFTVILLTAFLLLPSVRVMAQDIEKYIDRNITVKYKVNEPGAAVLVAREGNIIYNKGYGLASLELGTPMNTNMVFEVGSISKQFTAVAILMLEEQGKLSVSDPITKFLPDYTTHGHTITIHHLLTHTSGIRDFFDDESLMQKYMRTDMKPVEVMNVFKNLPPDFAPGERYRYNNTGYFLLGYIIEKVSGMPYAEFI